VFDCIGSDLEKCGTTIGAGRLIAHRAK
jgi:hypothetical protein